MDREQPAQMEQRRRKKVRIGDVHVHEVTSEPEESGFFVAWLAFWEFWFFLVFLPISIPRYLLTKATKMFITFCTNVNESIKPNVNKLKDFIVSKIRQAYEKVLDIMGGKRNKKRDGLSSITRETLPKRDEKERELSEAKTAINRLQVQVKELEDQKEKLMKQLGYEREESKEKINQIKKLTVDLEMEQDKNTKTTAELNQKIKSSAKEAEISIEKKDAEIKSLNEKMQSVEEELGRVRDELNAKETSKKITNGENKQDVHVDEND